MPMKAMQTATLPKCKDRSGRRVRTMRSTLCPTCFKKKVAKSGARSGGNAKGNPGNAGNANAKGNPANAGNANAKGDPGNAGNAKGNPANAGNANAKGNPGNTGNETKGAAKKRAGGRSGLKRSAKIALVVKKRWLDQILAGVKDWEIRGSSTARRGWIHFAESQAGGKLVGRARLVDCLSVRRSSFMKDVSRHCVTSLSEVPYKRIFAWVLKDAERFKRPFVYKHRVGAVIWIKV